MHSSKRPTKHYTKKSRERDEDIWIVYILFYNDESKKSPEEEWVLSQLNKIHKPICETHYFVSNNTIKCGSRIQSGCLNLLDRTIGIQ
jgi:hypothetical protein